MPGEYNLGWDTVIGARGLREVTFNGKRIGNGKLQVEDIAGPNKLIFLMGNKEASKP